MEEFIGELWHKLVGQSQSLPHYPEAAVNFADVKGLLPPLFRALGGSPALRLSQSPSAESGHRLKLLLRLGLGKERLFRIGQDKESLLLPPQLAYFPDREENFALYVWLIAYIAHLPSETKRLANPLAQDLAELQLAFTTSQAVLQNCPGLRENYQRLSASLRKSRPDFPRPPWEARIEGLVRHLLGGEAPPDPQLWALMSSEELADWSFCPTNYHPFLPPPLWARLFINSSQTSPRDEDDAVSPPGEEEASLKIRKKAQRVKEGEKKNPFILNRFEKILSLAEMLRLQRAEDDKDDLNAKKAAEEMEEIALGNKSRKLASRLRLDLDLAPEAPDCCPLQGEFLYPEWDYKRKEYLPRHCRVVCETAPQDPEEATISPEQQGLIRKVQRQFEALRPRRLLLSQQTDGEEIDIDAWIQAQGDIMAGLSPSSRLYKSLRPKERDLGVALLVDVSLSTDAWIENRRVLDVEKEALLVMTQGIAAIGDQLGIFTFTSRKRDWVRLQTVKDFEETPGPQLLRRINGLKPGYYTRMGPAIRHVSYLLGRLETQKRLLLLLSDGKPNDLDHYDGRHGLEDSQKAIREARLQGIQVFGITIDKEAQDYFPTLFGQSNYAIIKHLPELPAILPQLYRKLVG